jgi:lysophospholipase L1-like esterase
LQYGLQNAEVLNYGVNGYGTFHGSVLAKSYLPSVKPDVAIIYYGWNDRTRIVGWFDHRERVKFINSFWHHFACLRLFYRLTDPCIWNLRSSRKLQSVFGPQWLKRGQTLEQVEENLRSTVALFKRQGIKICLVTTPFGKNDFSGLVKEYEFANKRARLDMVNTIPFCAFAIYEYNQLIKKIAFETKSCLIDLQEEFERYCKNDIEKYFEHNDFVHPNAEGCRLIARWIALALSKDIGEKFYAAQEKSSLQ